MTPVFKAAFLFESEGGFFDIGPYPDVTTVQINPKEIKHNLQINEKTYKGIGKKESLDENETQGAQDRSTMLERRESMSMTLYFDIVSSLDFINETLSAIYNLFCDLPSNSGLITPSLYSKLKAACANHRGVCFYWGRTVFYGYITQFNSRFLYFNRFGNVLRVAVDLTISASNCLASTTMEELVHILETSELNPKLIVQRLLDVASDLTRS